MLYRLSLDVAVTAGDFTVTGRGFKHAQGSDPNDALGGQVGTTLSLPSTSLASKGLLGAGQVGIVASAISAVVDSSVTNFTGSSFGTTSNAYQDLSTTNDVGGRMIQLVLRINF